MDEDDSINIARMFYCLAETQKLFNQKPELDFLPTDIIVRDKTKMESSSTCITTTNQ